MITNTEIKFKSVAHYLRMMYAVCYDSDFELNGEQDGLNMKYFIGESWGASYCSYCHKYYFFDCCNCPLDTCKGCCNCLHHAMCFSHTWSDWLKNAHKVLKYIIDNG